MIQFNDIKNGTHYVNENYIVQLHDATFPIWNDRGAQIGTKQRYFVNVANAGVACYNAADYEVDEHTYFHILERLG